jgi:hypothetical protein
MLGMDESLLEMCGVRGCDKWLGDMLVGGESLFEVFCEKLC